MRISRLQISNFRNFAKVSFGYTGGSGAEIPVRTMDEKNCPQHFRDRSVSKEVSHD